MSLFEYFYLEKQPFNLFIKKKAQKQNLKNIKKLCI